MEYLDTSDIPGLLFTIPVITDATQVPRQIAFAHSVQPFLDWLLLAPKHLLHDVRSLQDFRYLYLSVNPFVCGLGLAGLAAPVLFLRAELSGNYSAVDRLWSVLPVLFAGHFALWSHWNLLNPGRNIALFLCTLVWGTRLTFNFWRKGGYRAGEEDYRWPILRARMPRWAFVLFNLTFISTIQVLILYMIAAPAFVLLLASTAVRADPFGPVDAGFCAALLAIVAFEAVADQQQWNFHQAKLRHQSTPDTPAPTDPSAADIRRGFLTRGLWSYSRHPNFLAEQSFWAVVYIWSCVAARTPYNWTGVGLIALLGIFQGSTQLTEEISAGKYPEYKEYQRQVGRFFPSARGLAVGGYRAPAAAEGKEEKKRK